MGKTPSDFPMSLTVDHVAEIMGIGRSKAYEMIHNPKFPVIREGRRVIIPRDAFFRWLDPGYSSTQPVTSLGEETKVATKDPITAICTNALTEAIRSGKISIEELVHWALRTRE